MSTELQPSVNAISLPDIDSQITELQTVVASPEMLPLTAERKAVFLNTVIETGGNVSKAATLLGMTRHNVYRWLQSDPVFAELYEHAMEHGTDNLEERAYVRAMDTSDRMMELLLKARRPEKYREQYKVEIEQGDGQVSGQLVELLKVLCERARVAMDQQAAQLAETNVIDVTPVVATTATDDDHR